jgi:hypothetical protein
MLAIYFVVLPMGSVFFSGMQGRKSDKEAAVVEISARERWYLDRAEKEESFQGTLRERKAQIGPGARGGLNFTLVSEGIDYPIYTGGANQKLHPFIGCFVRVRAKLVDLTKEGFGRELWVASLTVK